MKLRLSSAIILASMLSSVNGGIGTTRYPNPTLAVTPPESKCDRLGLLVRIQGTEDEVWVRREGQKDYHRISKSQVLCRGDRIKTGPNTRAFIRCEVNNHEESYPQDTESGASWVCPPPPIEDDYNIVRAHNEIISRQIISPRNTALLTKTPSFIWSAVSGATSYTVVLTNIHNEQIWEKNVKTTDMSYPTDEKPLEPGTYYLTVTPSPDKNSPPATFKVLKAEEANIVMAAVQQPELDDQVEIPSRVSVYYDYNLRNDAIKMLENLVKQGRKSDEVYLRLGDLYGEVENGPLAEQSYLKAVELVPPSNLKRQALARARLGNLYEAIGNKEKACLRLSEAKTLYEQAGETQLASAIELNCNK